MLHQGKEEEGRKTEERRRKKRAGKEEERRDLNVSLSFSDYDGFEKREKMNARWEVEQKGEGCLLSFNEEECD